MPSSIEAEQAVLGSMIIDARRVSEIITVLKPLDFYIEVNRDIYETIVSMFNYSMAIDPVTVMDQMKVNGTFTQQTSAYLVELMNITPTSANAMEYATIVKDKAILRALAETSGEISTMAFEGGGTVDEVLETAEKKIFAIRETRSTGGLQPVSQIMQSAFSLISEAAKRDGGLPGLSTGLQDLDNAIMGLNPSDLIFVASRPGMGKTSIAMNIALTVAKTSGKAVAVFSLEMSKEQLATRLLASESFVDGKKLQTGKLSAEEWKRIIAGAAAISRTNMEIDDNPMLTVSDMNAQCRRVKNLGLVVIDYLQLMTGAGGAHKYANENRTQVVSDISRMMKIMAKELMVPVICLSQLNRASAERSDKRPVLSDLRESGSIEQDADIVLGLYREGYYNRDAENPNAAECLVLKNRHGDTGRVDLMWIPEYTTYTSVEKRYSDDDAY